MAVTIDEMHVDVQAPKQTPAPAANAEPPKDVDLRAALELLHARQQRLKAD